MVKPELLHRILRFGMVGGIVTGTFMILNWWLAGWLGPDWAFLAAYPPAVGLHFWLNKWWTFGDHATVGKRQASEYGAMMITVFLLQAVIFKTLTGGFGVVPWMASGLAAVLQMALSFVWMQRRVFLAPARPGTD